MESAQYLYMNIEEMNGYFNWTMTYRRDSDFPRPYGHIVKVMVDSVLEFGCQSFVYGYFGGIWIRLGLDAIQNLE